MIPRVPTRLSGLVVVIVTMAGLLAGCGSVSLLPGHHGQAPGTSAGGSTDAAAVAVIREWSRALRRGDLSRAAHFFALPSVFANGVGNSGQLIGVVIRTEQEAERINESLPCGALLISTIRQGKYVNAAFRLTGRAGPGAGCGSGTGETANTDFLIRGGRIVEWLRAPAASRNPPHVPKVPASPQGSGVAI